MFQFAPLQFAMKSTWITSEKPSRNCRMSHPTLYSPTRPPPRSATSPKTDQKNLMTFRRMASRTGCSHHSGAVVSKIHKRLTPITETVVQTQDTTAELHIRRTKTVLSEETTWRSLFRHAVQHHQRKLYSNIDCWSARNMIRHSSKETKNISTTSREECPLDAHLPIKSSFRSNPSTRPIHHVCPSKDPKC